MRRGAAFRPLQEDDMKWLWAAYRRGAFDDDLPEDMTQEALMEAVIGLVQKQVSTGGGVLVAIAPTVEIGKAPVGLFVVTAFDLFLWPQVRWFPWATPRNKVESGVAFLKELVTEKPVMIIADEKDQAYLSHFSRYALIRRVGRAKETRKVIYEGIM